MKKVKKFRVPRTRNGGTMTNAMFFQWLRNVLRRSSMYWKPVAQVRKEAQVPYKGANKRRKYSYVCSCCGKEFAATGVDIHHKVPAGTLTSFDEISSFAERLFIEKEGLECLCHSCHNQKHEK